MIAVSTLAYMFSLLACTASDADTGGDTTSGGLAGDVPPMPAASSATIRSEGVDTTFGCVSRTSGFRTVSDDNGVALSLYCGADDSDPDNLAVFQLTDYGDLGVGTFEDSGTLQVVLTIDGVGWIGASSFSSVLTIDAIGAAPGERSTGTFQATWDEVSRDTDGDGTYETVDQPSALACAFDFVQD